MSERETRAAEDDDTIGGVQLPSTDPYSSPWPYLGRAGIAPSAALTGFGNAACRLWGWVLAAAAPGSGPLTTELLNDCGYRLGKDGIWTAFIDLDDNGEAVLTPFGGAAVNGVWTGTTRETDGRVPRLLRSRAEGVFRVELPGSAPLSRRDSSGEQLRNLEMGIGQITSQQSINALTMPIEERATTPQQWTEIADWLERRYAGQRRAGRIAVLPPGVEVSDEQLGPELPQSMVELREQLRRDVAAAFGINGLLGESEGAAMHAHWRLATVKTFEPLARLIEAEAALKLGEPVTLNREAWYAASHSDRARLIRARGDVVHRLAQLEGVSLDDARRIVAELDDD